ncbi:MAG: hypothetical protein ACLR23_20835 [Clostridia bacterium]
MSTIDIFDGTVNDIGAFGKGMATLGCTTEGQLYALSKAGELCKVNKADRNLHGGRKSVGDRG